MAIMARHSMEVVPSLQVVRSSVPDEVEDAVMRALEKTPADRFQTMRSSRPRSPTRRPSPPMMRTAARRAATASRRVPTREIQAAEPPPAAGRKRTLRLGGGLLLLLLVAGGAWAGLRHRGGRAPALPGAGADGLDAHRIAVLYFQDLSGKDSLGYLADGLTEGLIRQLGEVATLDVISANGVAPYRGDSIPRDSVARALKVGTLVQGSVERDGGRIRVNVRLVDGGSGADFQRASFEQPSGNLLAIRDTLSMEVAALIRQRLGPEFRMREQREGTKSPDAWALVQRAAQHQKTAEELAERGDSAGRDREFHSADSLLGAAEPLDAAWSEPVIARGTIAYRRARLSVDDPLQAGKWIDVGLGHAERGLKLVPQSPDALELRGDLRYLQWLLNLAPDPTQARALLKSAQDDLERAVKLNPSQASAWAMLSHLYYQTSNEVDVKLAARRAYEEDAYLSNADVVVSRLFFASYDLGQFPDAVHWCEEGQRRFPRNPKFVECRLWLLTTKARDPDVASAWRLADSLQQTAAASDREYQGLNARMLVAGVLARAGLADSARRLAARSRGRPEIDPTRDLLFTEAIVRTMLGDKDEALKALKSYLAVNPEKRAQLAEDPGWYFRSLAEDPRFGELVGTKP